MMIKKIFTLSLIGGLLLFSCNKNDQLDKLPEPAVEGKYKSIATISFPAYSVDYVFDNDHNISQVISPSVNLALGMSNVTGSYTMYYTTSVISSGVPNFANAQSVTVNFTAGNATVTLNGVDLSKEAASNAPYLLFVRFRANASNLPVVNSIYTIDLNKRAEFSSVIANSNKWGIIAPDSPDVAGDPIFINPITSSGIVPLLYSLAPTLTGNYDFVVQSVDNSTLISNMQVFPNINLTGMGDFTINFDFSEYFNSYGPITLNAYMVRSGLNTLTDPTTATPQATVSVQPLTVYIAGVSSFSPATLNGTLTNGVAANNVTASLPYTGGTGGIYPGMSFPSFGVTGLTATLSAGTLSNGNGTLTWAITGTPSAAGTASFQVYLLGLLYTFSVTVN